MKILVGICGSIAAYRSPDLIRQLLLDGHELEVVLTQSGSKFVTATTIETFLNKKIHSSDAFDPEHTGTEHIAKARWAEMILVYGATANTIARIAHGMADDFLTLQILASQSPLVLAPAMNPAMWKNSAVQENISVLHQRGIHLIGPIPGLVACGETGVGHIADIDEISSCLKYPSLLDIKHDLSGKKILISAGPMQSFIDPARRIANRSSGHMGLELARDARRRGAEVKVILGPVDKEVENHFKSFACARYQDPSSYGEALHRHFVWSDIFVSSAAVLDFKVKDSSVKLSRDAIAKSSSMQLPIEEVPDFVKNVCALKTPRQQVVAFALEDGSDDEIILKAHQKMKKKNCDWIIANPLRPGVGPESVKNLIWVCSKDGKTKAFGPFSKAEIAHQIWSELNS